MDDAVYFEEVKVRLIVTVADHVTGRAAAFSSVSLSRQQWDPAWSSAVAASRFEELNPRTRLSAKHRFTEPVHTRQPSAADRPHCRDGSACLSAAHCKHFLFLHHTKVPGGQL